MKYGFISPNFGYCGDPRVLVDLARQAEDAGWDGFFLWDHVQYLTFEPNADPWVALAAMAMATEKIRLGTMVTPLPRRRVAKLARETSTLDHLSGGRLILGVGLGAPELPEFTGFGDEGDLKTRGAMLDEGLDVLAALWSGEPVQHAGTHYRVETPGFAPPVQRPRIPVWVAGTWPARRPLRRAARWDGVVPITKDALEGKLVAADHVRELRRYISEHRIATTPFDVVQFGSTRDASDSAIVGDYVEAGATWWLEYVMPPLEKSQERLRKGPPRI